MRTLNKNYSDYIDNYNDSWKDTLDFVSDLFKIDTNGGKISSNPYKSSEEVLVLYCNSDTEAYKRNEKFRNYISKKFNSFVYKDYGPAYLMIMKK